MFLEVGTDASAHFQNDPDLDFLISRVHNIISNLFICKSLTFHKCDSVAFQAIWTLLNGAKTNMAMVCPLSSARLRHGRAEGLQAKGVIGLCQETPRDVANTGAQGQTRVCLC